MAHHAGALDHHDLPPNLNVQDLDVTVLAFAQWLSEMRSRSNASLQQMLAEMGIIRNGITSNNTELTEFKRNTATVQQQMQSQISDLRDKLTDAYTEIANMKKTKSQFEQEVHAEYQSLAEQLQFKTLELETLKKGYAHTHQLLQQQILQLQNEVNEVRMKGDDAHRQTHVANEQHVGKVGEVEMAAQYANNELKRLRSDHDQAIANLAENMNRWNETLRELSKEFHNLQKVMYANQQKIQSSLWEVQAATGTGKSGAADAPTASPQDPSARSHVRGSPPLGVQTTMVGGGAGRAQSPASAHHGPMLPPYSAAPQAAFQVR
jgi:predicted  nucleic acid-binding Zn-ribbon protein